MFHSLLHRIHCPSTGPRIERLEDRIAPANNVVTSFLGGTLTITTVDLFDEASVLAGDNDQNFQILAAGAGSVTVHQSASTTIDGVADKAFNGVVNIVLDLKEGSDTVSLKGGVNIPGDVTFKGGDGGSLFEFDGDAATTTVRNLSIINGDGVENVTFKDGNVVLTGNLSINNGDGGANMNIGFNAGDQVTINGALSLVAGAGADGLSFNGADLLVKGPVTLKGGTGNTFITFKYQNSVVLEQPITVLNGAGDNVFETNNLTKTFSVPSIKITNGPGNSRVTFDSNVSDTIAGDVTVTNSVGDNKFEVKDGAFSVGGKIKVTNGAGKSTTDVSPTGTNTVTGDFTLTNGVGDDTTTIGGTDVTYKNLKLVNRNGASTTTLTGTNLSFASISSTSGDGADAFTVNATNDFKILTGGLTLKQGTGTTSTTIGAGGIGAIAGALSITNGDGKDTQIIGNGAGNFSGLHNVTITNGRGGSTTTFNSAQLTITGSVAVTSGEGADTFSLGSGTLTAFNISGSVKLTYGLGGSTTKLAPTTSGILAGAFTVNGADGNDTVTVIRSTIGGAMTANLGAGNDTITVDNSTLAALKFSTGSGNDAVNIENTTNDGVGTTIFGTVSIDVGSGNDDILWGLDATGDFVTANQSVKLNGGLGRDEFNQSAATNAFAVPPTLTSFELQLP